MSGVFRVFEVWALLDELRRSGKYRGCFVAVDVCEVRVVGVDRDLRKLVERLRRGGVDLSRVVIEYIPERFVELVV